MLARPRGQPYTIDEAAAVLGVARQWLTDPGRFVVLQPDEGGAIAESSLRDFMLDRTPDLKGRNIDVTAVVAIVARTQPRRPTHLPQPRRSTRPRREDVPASGITA